MIYTVTLSPSLDYCMTFPHVTAGQVNRAQSAQIYPGGKGVNVSILLARLGTPTQAFGFCAGFTGANFAGGWTRWAAGRTSSKFRVRRASTSSCFQMLRPI